MIQVVGRDASVRLPSGWEVEFDAGASGPTEANQHLKTPRVHIANFPLPPNRGDFGSGAVERMGAGDVFICLLEEDPGVANTALYQSEGIPTFDTDDFAPEGMQRAIRGQSGAQKFFNINGRAFVVYIALGSHLHRNNLIDQINAVLGSFEL